MSVVTSAGILRMKTNEIRTVFSYADAKTTKGEKLGMRTGVMYMAPWKSALGNVCPAATMANCHVGCLVSAGRGAFDSVKAARAKKTRLFYEEREALLGAIVRDVQKLVRRAAKDGVQPIVRLNGTSDIRWERIPVTVDGVKYASVMEAFPAVQFYDYTKIAVRVAPHYGLPPNYDLTFSYSGVKTFANAVKFAVEAGARIAVVFRHRDKIPTTFMGMPVVDGDDTDVRHLDPKGVVVALYAKGKAKADASGFVVG